MRKCKDMSVKKIFAHQMQSWLHVQQNLTFLAISYETMPMIYFQFFSRRSLVGCVLAYKT